MKKTRQDRILSLIEEQDIETQEELARQLQLEGYSVCLLYTSDAADE